MVSAAAIHSSASPVTRTGSPIGPASPTSSTPMANIWMPVFHFARRETGMWTRTVARCSRRPETRISRQRMTSAGRMVAGEKRAITAEHEERGGDQQLVGDGIEEAAELRLLLPGARQPPVEPVGDASEREQDAAEPGTGGAGK